MSFVIGIICLLVGALSPVKHKGLRETFIKRNIVEGTNKANIRPDEESETASFSCLN